MVLLAESPLICHSASGAEVPEGGQPEVNPRYR